jgi:hypothetical protein
MQLTEPIMMMMMIEMNVLLSTAFGDNNGSPGEPPITLRLFWLQFQWPIIILLVVLVVLVCCISPIIIILPYYYYY